MLILIHLSIFSVQFIVQSVASALFTHLSIWGIWAWQHNGVAAVLYLCWASVVSAAHRAPVRYAWHHPCPEAWGGPGACNTLLHVISAQLWTINITRCYSPYVQPSLQRKLECCIFNNILNFDYDISTLSFILRNIILIISISIIL